MIGAAHEDEQDGTCRSDPDKRIMIGSTHEKKGGAKPR